MSLTERDKEIITKTWAVIRANTAENGIELFRRFFEANPSYIKHFPFADLDQVADVLRDSRLKLHAGRVMAALSNIVDHLNDPDGFQKKLQEIISDHVKRNISLEHFENLRTALVGLLLDRLGPEMMDEEAKCAWSKAYTVILDGYQIAINTNNSNS